MAKTKKFQVKEELYVAHAKRVYPKPFTDGDVDFDDKPKVSRGDEGGAFVMAWVWVRDEDVVDEVYLNPETGAAWRPSDKHQVLCAARGDPNFVCSCGRDEALAAMASSKQFEPAED